MSECRAWEPETLKQRDRQKWSAQKNLLCLASEVYNNSVPDSVPSAVAQDCCCRGRYSGYTGKHIKSFAVHRFLYSVESYRKEFSGSSDKNEASTEFENIAAEIFEWSAYFHKCGFSDGEFHPSFG